MRKDMRRICRLILSIALTAGMLGTVPTTFAESESAVSALESREDLNICFIGGSLTYGTTNTGGSPVNSWTVKIGDYFKERFAGKPVYLHNIGVGGTDSSYGLYRLYDDVLRYEPDVVFVDFAVNNRLNNLDRSATAATGYNTKRHMEGIVRQIMRLPKKAVIIFLDTTTKTLRNETSVTDSSLRPFSKYLEWHSEVAQHYDIPRIDLTSYINSEITAERLNEDDIWASTDAAGTHPLVGGFTIWANYIDGLLRNQTDTYLKFPDMSKLVSEPMSGDDFTSIHMMKAHRADAIGDGWRVSGTDLFSPATSTNASLTVKFSGKRFGLRYMTDANIGTVAVQYSLDGGKTVTSTTINHQKGFINQMLTESLSEGEHTLTLNKPNANELTIRAFIVDGEIRYPNPREESYLVNPDFEEEYFGWSVDPKWYVTSEESYTGEYSARLYNPERIRTTERSLMQNIRATTDTPYKLLWYQKTIKLYSASGAETAINNPFTGGQISNYNLPNSGSSPPGWSRVVRTDNDARIKSGNATRLSLIFRDNSPTSNPAGLDYNDIYIDDICFKPYTAPAILKSARDVGADVIVKFDEDTSDTALTRIKLYDNLTNTLIPCTVTSNGNDLEYKLSPTSGWLTKGAEYKVVAEVGIMNTTPGAYATTANQEIVFTYGLMPELLSGKITDGNDNEIYTLENAEKIKALCNLTNQTQESKRVSVILGLYNGDELIKTTVANSILVKGRNKTVEAVMNDLPENIAECRIKAFVLDSIDGLNPISQPIGLSSED